MDEEGRYLRKRACGERKEGEEVMWEGSSESGWNSRWGGGGMEDLSRLLDSCL